MEAAAAGRVLLQVPGVYLQPRLQPGPPRGEGLKGRLLLLQGPDDLILCWEPLEQLGDPPEEEAEELPDPGYEPDWAVLSLPRPPPQPHGWGGGFQFPLGELRGVRRSPPGLRRPLLVLLPRGGPCPPPLSFSRAGGGPRNLLRVLGPRLRQCPWDPRLLLVSTPGDPPQDPPPEPPPSGIVTRLLQGPYAAMGGLGRLLAGPRNSAPLEEVEPGAGFGAEGAGPEKEPPFEVIHCVTLGPRPTPSRNPPMTEAEWEEGRSLAPEVLRERIFRGGLSPEVRLQGWRFLLGLGGEDPQNKERRDSYLRMKLQWGSLSPGQWSRNSLLRGFRRRLEKDLSGGPPHVPPPERGLLRDLLLTYCMFNFDLGYVRGMSEVLRPLLSVAPQEVEAFWGYCSIMEMVNWGAPRGAAADGSSGDSNPPWGWRGPCGSGRLSLGNPQGCPQTVPRCSGQASLAPTSCCCSAVSCWRKWQEPRSPPPGDTLGTGRVPPRPPPAR
ncbi:TBC1 domain family member 17-like isoform X10 [Pogoniulus pusillus]|uniref:TBC1 domain family member 17-like isoform X10 n=1 Tax=Pogoniulus pusillus TaxID=488313 RepID=UPI0030B9242F